MPMPAYLRDAVAVMSEPGHTLGPCDAPCAHADCRTSRAMAAKVCPPCGREIGYETPFRVAGGALVHAACPALEAVA